MLVKSILVESELQQEPEFVNKRFTCVWQWPMVLQPLLNAHARQFTFGLAQVDNKPCFRAEALAPHYMKSKAGVSVLLILEIDCHGKHGYREVKKKFKK